MGLAVASNLGITLQTLIIALLLHQRRMVSLASLDYAEMGRCLMAAATSGTAVWIVFGWLVTAVSHLMGSRMPLQGRWMDLVILVAGSALWVLIAVWVLKKAGSALPGVMMKRLRRV
jgi:putative peptidoglycan lipid II flippase